VTLISDMGPPLSLLLKAIVLAPSEV
jgi:hypothetical protein